MATYSSIIRLCNGTSNDPSAEPGPYAWDLSSSLQEGNATITKIFNFRLSDAARGSGIKSYEVCPVEVMKASGFPVRFSTLPEATKYKYYGNGTIELTDPDSEYWKYRAEYVMQRSASTSKDANSDADDEKTKPWNRRPTNVSISFPEIVIPFRAAYNANNNRYTKLTDGTRVTLVPVTNTAGDIIETETKKNYVQLSFTYALDPTDFDVNKFLENYNSINKSQITVCGITFPAASCLLVSTHPQYHNEVTDSTESKSWTWWEIEVVLQYDPSGDEFEQQLVNLGNRALWHKSLDVGTTGIVFGASGALDTVPSEIYHWRSFASTTHGQNGSTESVQFGNLACAMKAKTAFDNRFKASKGWTFVYEKDAQMPLNTNGTLDIDCLTPGHARYKKPRVRSFQEHKRKEWSSLKFPKKGVNW
jgi:hypothetical protein